MFKRKVVDEREKMEMYKIEHYGFWLVFWGLLISIFVQMIAFDASFKEIGAEWIVFMCMAIGSGVAYGKAGHYDYYTEPGLKSSLIYATVFTIIFEVAFGLYFYINDMYYNLMGLAITIVIATVFMFFTILIFLLVTGKVIAKRRKKLEEDFEEDI
ncbi:MAG: hypothetical protein JJE03_06590 [Peptostreptococcaceae bacterium]|nr:hypothetical protein [Peptostreptococcaceae bacterium]